MTSSDKKNVTHREKRWIVMDENVRWQNDDYVSLSFFLKKREEIYLIIPHIQ